MTKDVTDYERNFLRYLRISIEQERSQATRGKFKERASRIDDNAKSRAAIDSRAPGTVQNWVPVWPQLDQGFTSFEW